MSKFFKSIIAFMFLFSILAFGASEGMAAAAGSKKAAVNASKLNVRIGPSTSYKVLGTLHKNAVVTVKSTTKTGWAQVSYDELKGYVFAKYLTFSKPGSYLRNNSKVYFYKTPQGIQTERYVKTQEGWNFWEVKINGKTSGFRLEMETKSELRWGYPNSEYYKLLKHPMKIGTSWYVGYEGEGPRAVITSTSKTIKTPIGTFRNAIEVKRGSNISYFVKGFGLIKQVDEKQVIAELVMLKNR